MKPTLLQEACSIYKMIPINNRTFIVSSIILLFIVGIRVAYSFLALPSGDGGMYLFIADKLLKGEYLFSNSPDTFPLLYRTPIYPLFLSFISLLPGNSLKIAMIIQHLIGVFSAFIIYKIGMQVCNHRLTAAAGALFTGMHFHFLYFESYPLSETLSIFLICATLYLAMILCTNEKAGLSAFAFGGLVAACAGLCRPELIPIGLICIFFIWTGIKSDAKMRLYKIFAYLLPILMFIGAWVLRNGLLFDYWGITPNAQIAFFDGPAGRIISAENVKPDIVNTPAMEHRYDYGGVNRAVSFLAIHGVPYEWSSRRIGALALNAMLNNPAGYFRESLSQLYITLSGSTWPPRDIAETMPDIFSIHSSKTWLITLLTNISKIDSQLESTLLIPFFLAGCILVIFSRRSKNEIFLLAVPLYLLIVYTFLSPTCPRYRVMVEPFMGLLAIYAVYRICFYKSCHIQAPLPVRKCFFSPDWLSSRGHMIIFIIAFCSWGWFMFNLSVAYKMRSLSSSPEAIPLLTSINANPADKNALIQLGYLSLKRRTYPKALHYFDRALRINPEDKSASDGRAEALFRMGRGKEALEEFNRCLDANPDSPDLFYNIALINYLSGNKAEAVKNFSRFLKFPSMPPASRHNALKLRAELFLKNGEKNLKSKINVLDNGFIMNSKPGVPIK